MQTNEQRNVPKNPAPAKPLPDDGPEDMELTIPMKAAAPLNVMGNAFDEETKKRFEGLNTRASAFEKGTLFHTEG